MYVCILEEVMEYIKLFISADKVGPSKYLIFEISADFQIMFKFKNAINNHNSIYHLLGKTDLF